MQPSTSTIARFSRSFAIENTTSKHGENVKEKIVYSEFQAFGEPFAGLGAMGDIFVDVTTRNCALFAKFEGGWKKWPGPTQRANPLYHPVHSKHVLWCKLDKKLMGWIPEKSLSRVLISSSSQVISAILESRATARQKHVKKQSRIHPLPPPTKKPRLGEPPPSSTQAEPSTNPVRNTPINYGFSFPPFVDSIVTFIDKSVFPATGLCSNDSQPQSDTQHNATREARRSLKHMNTQNMQNTSFAELDDDLMAESQRMMDAIMGSTSSRPPDAAATEALVHDPPVKQEGSDKELVHDGRIQLSTTSHEPSSSHAPSLPFPPSKAQRSSSSGSSSTLSESGPPISPTIREPPGTSPSSGVQSPTKLPHSPLPMVKNQDVVIARKRPSWAMSDEEMHRVSASSSVPQLKPVPALGDESEQTKTPSSRPTSVSLQKRRLSAARKRPSPPELRSSFPSPDASSTPISIKREHSQPSMGMEETMEAANRTPSSDLDYIQPRSPLTPQERVCLTTWSLSRKQLYPISPSSSGMESPIRTGKATTNVQTARKRLPSLTDAEVERGPNINWDWPPHEESCNPNPQSPSISANIKLEEARSSPLSAARPLIAKRLKKTARTVSAPVGLHNKRPEKCLTTISAGPYRKRSRVSFDNDVVDLTGMESESDDVIEIFDERKPSSVIMSPTKFKVKDRQPLQVMPKHKPQPDYKRKATFDREVKAKQRLKNKLNMENIIDLTLVSDEDSDSDDQAHMKPLLRSKRVELCSDGVERPVVSTVKNEDVFGDIEMTDLTALSRNHVEEFDAGLGDGVDTPNGPNPDGVNEGSLEGPGINRDEDDKNDESIGLPTGSDDALEDGRHYSPCVERNSSGEGDEMKEFVPPFAHLPEFPSDSESASSDTATDDQVDELKDEADGSDQELGDADDPPGKSLPDIASDLRLTNVHLRLLFDLDGERYCRACLSHEPAVYWQVPPGSVELVSDQLMKHCVLLHLQICEQFAELDEDELKEIERTVI